MSFDKIVMLLTIGASCAGMFIGCRPDEPVQPPSEPPANPAGEIAKKPKEDILVFPAELRVADESVNEFVDHAMRVCGSGKYEDFRLLWSVREEPLPRDEYEQGWRAVREIRIRVLQPALLANGEEADGPKRETVYAVLAEVRFDPENRAISHEPQNDVALMIVRERGDWRLSGAPEKMRAWLKEKTADRGTQADKEAGTTRDSPSPD